MDPAEFDLRFDALGSKANLERHRIYLVNSCDHLGYEQPKCPFGKTDNNSSFNRWYTYGKRLKKNTSVRSFWDPDFPNRTEFPASVAHLLAGVTEQSPAKKRKAASSTAAADLAGIPDDAAAAAFLLSLVDDRAAAVAASDGAAAQLWYQSLEPAPVVKAKGPRERKLYTHNNQSVVVEIDATDVTTPLELAQQLALYALIKRSVVGCPQGEEGCTLGPEVTCNNRELVFKVVMQRKSEELGKSAQRMHGAQATAAVAVAGRGDVSAGIVILATHNKDNLAAFKHAAVTIGVTMHERMDAMDGLQMMVACKLSWSQYRSLNSFFCSKFDKPVLATENSMRGSMLQDHPIVLECGTTEVTDRKGEEFECSFSRAKSLIDALEKEVGALFQSNMINSELETPESPFKARIALKFLGDKGGRSTKFGFVVINAKDPNSPRRFVALCDFEALDNHSNLKKLVFDKFAVEMDALTDLTMLIFQCGGKTVAKLVPKECSLVTVGSRASAPAPPAAASSVPAAPTTPTAPARAATRSQSSLNSAICMTRAATDEILASPASPIGAEIDEEGTWALLYKDGEYVGVGYQAPHSETTTLFYKFRAALPATGEVTVQARSMLKFHCGDYAWLATMCGCQGASAKKPCIWDLIEDADIQAGSWATRHPDKCRPRSVGGLHADAAKYAKSSGTAAAAQANNSVTSAPLLTTGAWDMDDVVPPFLHLFLGPILKLWKLLCADVRQSLDDVSEAMCKLIADKETVDECIKGLEADVKTARKEVRSLVDQGQIFFNGRFRERESSPRRETAESRRGRLASRPCVVAAVREQGFQKGHSYNPAHLMRRLPPSEAAVKTMLIPPGRG
jgi:hypothetical protein